MRVARRLRVAGVIKFSRLFSAAPCTCPDERSRGPRGAGPGELRASPGRPRSCRRDGKRREDAV